MLDTSSSIRQRFQFEQDSAIEFLLQVLHLNDRAFVEGFDVQTDLAQDFTNNVDLLNQGIRKLRPGGGTALFDALYKTCRDQMLTLRDPGRLRRALILVSDGDDNYSRAEESDAIKMCQRAQTIVYSISTNVSPSKDKGDEVLQGRSPRRPAARPSTPSASRTWPSASAASKRSCAASTRWSTARPTSSNDGSFRTIYLQAHRPALPGPRRGGLLRPPLHRRNPVASRSYRRTKQERPHMVVAFRFARSKVCIDILFRPVRTEPLLVLAAAAAAAAVAVAVAVAVAAAVAVAVAVLPLPLLLLFWLSSPKGICGSPLPLRLPLCVFAVILSVAKDPDTLRTTHTVRTFLPPALHSSCPQAPRTSSRRGLPKANSKRHPDRSRAPFDLPPGFSPGIRRPPKRRGFSP